jgi:hypothetical protein
VYAIGQTALVAQQIQVAQAIESEPALERLRVNLEKRDLIGHNLGLVDDTSSSRYWNGDIQLSYV